MSIARRVRTKTHLRPTILVTSASEYLSKKQQECLKNMRRLKMAVVMGKRTMSLKQMRKHYKKIAYELLYPEYVQDELDEAKDEEEMSNIMTTARKESMKYGRR
jgi:hypothetical protein